MAANEEGNVSVETEEIVVNVSYIWTDNKIEMLIENFKKYRVLFDVTYKEYKNKGMKENA